MDVVPFASVEECDAYYRSCNRLLTGKHLRDYTRVLLKDVSPPIPQPATSTRYDTLALSLAKGIETIMDGAYARGTWQHPQYRPAVQRDLFEYIKAGLEMHGKYSFP